MFYLDSQDSVLCPKCADESDSDPDQLNKFRPVSAYVNYEAEINCDNCSCEIESAYDIPQTEEG